MNILCGVSAANGDHAKEVYRFSRDELGARYTQLIPIVERAREETIDLANRGWGGLEGSDRPLYEQEGSLVTKRSVGAEQFGRFLIGVFDEWVQRDVGRISVTTFDVPLGIWLGQHDLRIVAPTCGTAPVLEHNGDVYCWHHDVEPDHRLGNIDSTTIAAMLTCEQQRRFGDAKRARCRATAANARCCSPATASAPGTDSSRRPTRKRG